MDKADCIVVGAGGVGSAAMYHLSRRGAKVLGLDRFTPPHDRGSSHGQTRIIRNAYFEHADYVPLLDRAYTLWRELEASTGQRLYDEIGLLEVGPDDGVLVPGIRRAGAVHGCAVEEIDEAEVRDAYPGLAVPDGMVAVFERNAGLLRVEACIRAHLDAARSNGAKLAPLTAVKRIEGKDDGVETDTAVYHATSAVVTAGVWARDLLEGLGVQLRVLRKTLFWYTPDDPAMHVSSGCPVFAYETPGGIYYGFPAIDENGLKLAEHSGGDPVDDPLDLDRSLDAAERDRVEAFAKACLRKPLGPFRTHAVCMYTMTPDEHFIVGTHPQYPQIVFAAGLSGHGFKFTTVLGEILASLALEGETSHTIDFLSLSRFQS